MAAKFNFVKVADRITAIVGSWKFVVVQSMVLLFWIIANVMAVWDGWDPYPFILLNLVLSFQAAYTAPIIMISQNKQAEKDRQAARLDLVISQKIDGEVIKIMNKLESQDELIAECLSEFKSSSGCQLGKDEDEVS